MLTESCWATWSNRADAVLPPGFDKVLIAKQHRDKIIACGRNPDRREADIDERGRPINTKWGTGNV